MRFNGTMTRSIVLSLALTTLLSGCASGRIETLLALIKPGATTVIACPKLDGPPVSAIDALDADAKVHPETGQWEVKLEKHLTKLDECAKAKK